jgi:uncharacterized protein YjhX (UPF0386 family)
MLETIKAELAQWGRVASHRDGHNFTLTVVCYEKEFGGKVADMLAHYFGALSMNYTVSNIKGVVSCRWEVRK